MKPTQMDLFQPQPIREVKKRIPVGLQATLDEFYWRFQLMKNPPSEDLGGERLDDNNLEAPCK